jgi:hypothetical protein
LIRHVVKDVDTRKAEWERVWKEVWRNGISCVASGIGSVELLHQILRNERRIWNVRSPWKELECSPQDRGIFHIKRQISFDFFQEFLLKNKKYRTLPNLQKCQEKQSELIWEPLTRASVYGRMIVLKSLPTTRYAFAPALTLCRETVPPPHMSPLPTLSD